MENEITEYSLAEMIRKLNHGQCYVVPESDYGKAEIWRINNHYFVFAIPMFGGEPVFEGAFALHMIHMIEPLIYSWT